MLKTLFTSGLLAASLLAGTASAARVADPGGDAVLRIVTVSDAWSNTTSYGPVSISVPGGSYARLAMRVGDVVFLPPEQGCISYVGAAPVLKTGCSMSVLSSPEHDGIQLLTTITADRDLDLVALTKPAPASWDLPALTGGARAFVQRVMEGSPRAPRQATKAVVGEDGKVRLVAE